MSHSSSVQIDDQFFKNQMGERMDSNQKSFPVKVVAMRIDWFLNYVDGKNFFEELLRNENLEFYNIPTL